MLSAGGGARLASASPPGAAVRQAYGLAAVRSGLRPRSRGGLGGWLRAPGVWDAPPHATVHPDRVSGCGDHRVR